LQLQPQESLWLHWDRSHPQTQTWLREASGLSEFACDLLLEENTRPRLLPLPDGGRLLLFLRGVNLNPGAEPEDMVALRIFADCPAGDFLRLRPVRRHRRAARCSCAGMARAWKTAWLNLILYSWRSTLTAESARTLVSRAVGNRRSWRRIKLDTDERYTPEHGSILQIASAKRPGLARYLAPQREIFAQLTRIKLPWFCQRMTMPTTGTN
jgi:zinc transporter